MQAEAPRLERVTPKQRCAACRRRPSKTNPQLRAVSRIPLSVLPLRPNPQMLNDLHVRQNLQLLACRCRTVDGARCGP
eukprot:7391076-Prymnesium_polylepis.2